jgi:integrase
VQGVLDGDARKLWDFIKNKQKGYSRCTTWVRVTGFWSYLNPHEENPYRQFKQENKRLFENQYFRRTTTETMKEAREKIDKIEDPAIRKKALELLLTGMRYAESFTLQNGVIEGKGGLKREVNMPEIEGPEYKGSYRSFLNALDWVGLKPHTLRKIHLTECVNSGANIFELQVVAGWKNLESAKSYIAVSKSRISEIQNMVRKKSV